MMAIQDIEATHVDGELVIVGVDGNGNEVETAVSVGAVGVDHTWLGKQSDAPTDEEIGEGNVALYVREDGGVYKRPYGGSQTAIEGGSSGLEEHGNDAHSAAFLTDGDGTERQVWVIANGASDPSGAAADDLIFEEQA